MGTLPTVVTYREVVDDRKRLLDILPADIREAVDRFPPDFGLVEVVMDLGRRPEVRSDREFHYVLERVVTAEDLAYVVSHLGPFGPDNRAGIPQTLHRVSAIRNRQGKVVGVTCRVGRAVFGTIDILRDVVETGRSLLLLGRPGVGKTTMLREIARVLSDEFKRRVIIVDTSNEIAGDGDIPHPAIGRARRMQVPLDRTQAQVMIEAVENHMPEVVVIDEIGTEEEARAARTIAERGVQLIATAHGNTLENLVLNPTLSDLVGGIQAVTLGDEEARKRGTQKTVLERKSPPTFEVLVEIHSKDRFAIHHDVAKTVDLLLRGIQPFPEVRTRDPQTGRVNLLPPRNVGPADLEGAADDRPPDGVTSLEAEADVGHAPAGLRPRPSAGPWGSAFSLSRAAEGTRAAAVEGAQVYRPEGTGSGALFPRRGRIRIYTHGISRGRLERLIDATDAPVSLTEHLHEADLVLTIKGQYRKMPKKLKDAERKGLPVRILRNNTIEQMERFLAELAAERPYRNGHPY